MIDREFNVLKNLHRIAWKPTLWINFLRATCATPVLILFSALSGEYMSIEIYLLYPLFYLAILGPFLYLFKTIVSAFSDPMGGVVVLLFATICIVGGDPSVFLIHKIKPEIVPLERYPFLCFAIFLFVLRGD